MKANKGIKNLDEFKAKPLPLAYEGERRAKITPAELGREIVDSTFEKIENPAGFAEL